MIGRIEEIKFLEKKYKSAKSEFIALYGRRRVGKTFLVRNLFQDRFDFQFSGMANVEIETQLQSFYEAVNKQHKKLKLPLPQNWLVAFQQLITIVEKSKHKKKVIFIDELPWLDTANSNFLQALEHFWNSWASARKDILLVVCGSAASWIINKLINNKGGLHNRVTGRLKIEPFTLNECEQFSIQRKLGFNQYQLIQLYMVMGGIPFYWDELEKGKSATQNINKICFQKNGLLKIEFNNIFKSLFNNAEKHEKIIATLAQVSKGMTRDELLNKTKLTNGGSFTRILNELEESGFIRKYKPFGKKTQHSIYQLSDFYSLFYFKFIKNNSFTDANYWTKMIDHPSYRAWSGYAFEQVCLYHINEIKQALGISGIETETSCWRSTTSTNGTQIDLIIDRRDSVINICEMKFSISPFMIDKKYDAVLRNKLGIFKQETKTKKALFLTMITTFGIAQNNYAGNVQNNIIMDVLFK